MNLNTFIRKTLSYALRHTPGTGFIPDRPYLTMLYRLHIGGKMDWDNPRTFNQKIQWLKIQDHNNTKHTNMVDKYAVKEIVCGIVGEEYVIPTLGIYNSFDEIDFSKLPDQFVMKTTHGGGGLDVVVVKEKKKMEVESIRNKINSSLKRSLWQQYREWPYRNVPRRIIVEKYLEDEHGELRDYKFFCMNGEPKFLFVATGRLSNGETTFDFLDLDYKRIPAFNGHPNMKGIPVPPANFKGMVDLARKLAQGEKFVRVDLYNVNGRIYFGEYTFYHNSGLVPFEPESYDLKFGQLIKL